MNLYQNAHNGTVSTTVEAQKARIGADRAVPGDMLKIVVKSQHRTSVAKHGMEWRGGVRKRDTSPGQST